MKYKIVIFLLVVFIWIFFIILANYTEKKFQEDILSVTSMTDDLDDLFYEALRQEEESSLEGKSDLSNDWGWLEDDYVTTSNDDFEIDVSSTEVDVRSLENIYRRSFSEWDIAQAIIVLEAIYEENWDPKILDNIINLAISNYMFDLSYSYIKKDIQNIHNYVDPVIILYVIINSIEYTVSNIDMFKSIVNDYYSLWLINDDYYNFYMWLLDIIYFRFDDFIEKINLIETVPELISIKNDVAASVWQYYKFIDAPLYYKQWLIWFVLLQHWYFMPAERVALEIIKLNRNYILPNQIIAYWNFILWKYERSNDYFSILINIDWENSSQYNFFVGVNNFWLDDFTRSIAFLSQVNSWPYRSDAIRYSALSYYKLGQVNNMLTSFESLLRHRPLNAYDYYSFFDNVFYRNWFDWWSFELFRRNSSLIVRYITACYEDLWSTNPEICRFARAWFHFARWEKEIWLRYLEFVVERYPRDYLFKALWDYYFEIGDYELSRQNYLKAIVYASDAEFRSNIRDDLLQVLILQRWN